MVFGVFLLHFGSVYCVFSAFQECLAATTTTKTGQEHTRTLQEVPRVHAARQELDPSGAVQSAGTPRRLRFLPCACTVRPRPDLGQ